MNTVTYSPDHIDIKPNIARIVVPYMDDAEERNLIIQSIRDAGAIPVNEDGTIIV